MRWTRIFVAAAVLGAVSALPLSTTYADRNDPVAPGANKGTKKKPQSRSRSQFSMSSPVVVRFRDCTVDYVIRNSWQAKSDDELASQAIDTDCAQAFNDMASAVTSTFWVAEKRDEIYGKIKWDVVAPAVRAARKREQDRVAELKARAGEIYERKSKVMTQCLVDNVTRGASQTKESAEAIEAAAFDLCYQEILDAAAARYAQVSAGGPDLGPDTRQKATDIYIAGVKKDLHPAIMASIVTLRSGGGQSSTPQPAEPEGDASGTGVAISKRFLLTNDHVVEKCAKVWIEANHARQAGEIVISDPKQDLAVVRASQDLPQTASLRSSDGILMGESVYVFGFPLTGALSSNGNFTEGSITALEGLSDDPHYFQISAPVQPGNSGGPLIDAYGQLIGIVTSKLNAVAVAGATGDIPQNVNFAIKLSEVKGFLKANGFAATESSLSQELAKTEIAKRAQAFTARIICER